MTADATEAAAFPYLAILVAVIAGLLSLIWLATAFTVASVQFSSARDHGSAPVEALARADIAALRAHADESLTPWSISPMTSDLGR